MDGGPPWLPHGHIGVSQLAMTMWDTCLSSMVVSQSEVSVGTDQGFNGDSLLQFNSNLCKYSDNSKSSE